MLALIFVSITISHLSFSIKAKALFASCCKTAREEDDTVWVVLVEGRLGVRIVMIAGCSWL